MHPRTRLLAFSLLTVALLAAPLRAAEEFKVDNAHSAVIFRINHLGSSWVYGRFDEISGTFVMDEKKPADMKFDISVTTDSIDTNNKQRDTHLKSATFFSVKEFPTITFKSKEVKPAGEKKFEVTGDLMLHGVTKSVTIPVEFVGTSDAMGHRAGYEAHFTVKRSEYGMSGFLDKGVGDEVHLTVSLEGTGK